MITTATLLTIAGGVISILAVVVGLIVKVTRKWTIIEERLKELVENKEAVHAAILETMKEDRRVTDERLRWLEENVWTGRVGRRK